MSSQFLAALGVILLLIIVLRILSSLYNILVIYLFRKPQNLRKLAGAPWAVITGSTDGIGKAYAFELAASGFNVFLVSRSQQKLDLVQNEILQKHPNIEVRTLKFNFKTSSSKAYEELLKELNQVEIGILVNNVGMCYDHPDEIHELDLEELRDVVVVDTLPPTLLTARILPQMLSRNQGIIVNIGSFAGSIHVPLVAAYSACKKYVEHLTATLRLEYPTNVIFQTITPLLVATNMTEVTETSFFTPDPSTFAKSALNTIGASEVTTGYLGHQIQFELIHMLPTWLLNVLVVLRNKRSREQLMKKRGKPS